MHETNTTYLQGQVVEKELHLTLTELCRACDMAEEHVTTWVFEGVIEPTGQLPQDWQFGGPALRRAARRRLQMGSRLSRSATSLPASDRRSIVVGRTNSGERMISRQPSTDLSASTSISRWGAPAR